MDGPGSMEAHVSTPVPPFSGCYHWEEGIAYIVFVKQGRNSRMAAQDGDLAVALQQAIEAVARQGDVVRSLKADAKDGKADKVGRHHGSKWAARVAVPGGVRRGG